MRSDLKSVNEMDHEANLRKKFANVKPQRVKAEESFVPTIEEDETVEHLLAEPKTDNFSVDGVLNFGGDKSENDLGIGEFSCGYDYFLGSYRGGFDSNAAQEGRDELGLGDLDGLLDEVEEVEDFHAIDGLPSPSEDFLLEIGFSGQASLWDYPPCGGSHSRNISSVSQSPGLSGSSNSAVGISESSSVTIQELECKNDSLNDTNRESRGILKHKKRRKTEAHGRIVPASGDFQNPSLEDDDDDDDPLLSSMIISKSVKNLGEANNVGCSRREKRTRRPTQRYIEELSDKKSKHIKREGKFASADLKEKRPKVKSQCELYPTRAEEELVSETKVQVEVRRRGRPKKQVLVLPPKQSEDEYTSESEDERDTRKRSDKHDRRKHQRMWTVTEVTRLVDGISEFGVGHWTDIKRLLFATSGYRTPIDLRDKWRNLLRASSLHKLKKKVIDEKQSHPLRPLRPLPKSLIRRVRELAKVHPYPRERGSKKGVGRVTVPLRKSQRK